jgi:tetratricopeptide (TPR) repeat protein
MPIEKMNKAYAMRRHFQSTMRVSVLLLAGLIAGAAYADDKEDCEKQSGEQALAACTRLIESRTVRGPDLAKLYVRRGTRWAVKGDHERAIKDFEDSISIDPTRSWTFTLLGHSYRTQGDLDRAIKSYTEAIQLEAKDPNGYYYRASAYRAQGDFDRALADYDEMIKIDPDDPDAYNARGIAFAAKGALAGAIEDYGKAIALDAEFALAYSNRGDAYRRQGDLARAIADYDEAIKRDPKDAVAVYKRANSYRLRGDYDRAIEGYGAVIALTEKEADGYYERGITHLIKRAPNQAIADLDRAIAIEPKNASAFHARGLAYALKNEPERAIADYSEAIRLEPGNAERYTVRAWQSFRMERLQLALLDADHAVALDPELVSAYSTRARIHEALGESDLAEADKRSAAQLLAKRGQAEADARAKRDQAEADARARREKSEADANAARLAARGTDDPDDADRVSACPATFDSGRYGNSELTCTCGPGSMTGTVWGTDIYTNDSSICAAARHAGAVGPEGGTVRLRGAPGRARYAASRRNGIASSSGDRWDGSFTFTSATVGAPDPAPARPAPPAANRLLGDYSVQGVNPNGTTYSGTVTISGGRGGTYNFRWLVGRDTFRGTGRLRGRTLTVNWGQQYPVIYRVEDDGTLRGTWSNGRATEDLTPDR